MVIGKEKEAATSSERGTSGPPVSSRRVGILPTSLISLGRCGLAALTLGRNIYRQAAKVRRVDGIADRGSKGAPASCPHLLSSSPTSVLCPPTSVLCPPICLRFATAMPARLRYYCWSLKLPLHSDLRPLTSSSSPSPLQTAHLNLESPLFACFKGTRKCGIGRNRNFFRKFSACTNICPTPRGKS